MSLRRRGEFCKAVKGGFMDLHITNNAGDVPFSFIVAELLAGNIEKSQAKQETYKKMNGIAAIDLPDIEAVITLIFGEGKLTIEPGIVHNPAIIIKTSSDLVTDLNLLNIRFGLPYYFDAAGLNVIRHILQGRLKIKGMLLHLILLTRLTIIMSVM
jgi:hypothetical protein